ncbi:MAG: futalosine hydrolase [Phycisphaerales bacterium]|nr:futalosine hydrolase [Phycisphaerales bacterium]
MTPELRQFVRKKAADARLLLVLAAPSEARAVAGDRASAMRPWAPIPIADGVDLVLSGVGKANAAGATAAALARGGYGAVINLGVCGTLPGSPAAIGDVVLATRSVFADEGVESEAGTTWQPMAALGFPTAIDGDGVEGDPELMPLLQPLAAHVGVIATVSTCSGTDARAAAVVTRTGAIVEAMEGAGVLLSAARLGVPGVELRVVSNTTGERGNQKWELKRALAILGDVARRIVAP